MVPKVALIIETSREYGRGLLRGITKYSSLHGPWMFYRQSPFYLKQDSLKKMITHIKNWGATGIIVREQEGIDEILKLGLPTVISPLTKRQISGYPCIFTDCLAIAKLGAEYFLKLGFRNFAFCGYHHAPSFAWSDDRCMFFEQQINKAGLQVHIYEPPKGKMKQGWDNEQQAMVAWLKSLPKPVALMTCADDRSQNIIEACKIADIKVPEEIAILGTDNDRMICELSYPPLSSIKLNIERAGYEAAERLDMGMNSGKMDCEIISVQPVSVAARQSTDVMAIEDKTVLKALRYIRQNVHDMIQVDNITDEVSISRRSLERRFRKTLGCSIRQEIARIRVEQMVRFLLETNYSILKIARTFGFSGVDHISRYFRKVKGISPQAFRKKYGAE